MCPHALQACVHMTKCMCPYVSLYLIFVLGDDEDNESDDDDEETSGTDEGRRLFGSSADECSDDEASTSVSLLFS